MFIMYLENLKTFKREILCSDNSLQLGKFVYTGFLSSTSTFLDETSN